MRGRLTSVWYQVGRWRMHALAPSDAALPGPPIVLVHGYGVSGRYWGRLARRLAGCYPIYVPDLPGHGPSGKPAQALDVLGFRDALHAWMEAASVPRAVLVANSMGCQIAAELAAAEPGRVAALVLSGPTVDPAARTAPRQILRLVLSAPAEDPRLGAILVGDYLRAGVRRLRAELDHMLRHRIERVLPAVDSPALVIRGTWDRVVPRRWASQAAALLPRGTLVEIAGAGHAAHYTRPRATAERILTFLDAAGPAVTARPAPPPADTPPPVRAARARGAPE